VTPAGGSAMTGEVRIREAERRDLEALAALWLEFMEFHASRDADLAVCDGAEGHWKKWAAGKMESRDSVVAAAERNGRTVGYAVATIKERSPVFKRRRYGEIMETAVTADARGGGIGSRLYDFVMSWLKRKDVDWAWLEVAAKNETAGEFWERKGFRPFLETHQRDI